jgi:hypothetical protein
MICALHCRRLLLQIITLRDATLGRTSVDEWRPVAGTCTWQNTTVKRDKHPCPAGIRTHIPSKRAAADLHLRPRDHRHRCRGSWLVKLEENLSLWAPLSYREISSRPTTLIFLTSARDRGMWSSLRTAPLNFWGRSTLCPLNWGVGWAAQLFWTPSKWIKPFAPAGFQNTFSRSPLRSPVTIEIWNWHFVCVLIPTHEQVLVVRRLCHVSQIKDEPKHALLNDNCIRVAYD